MLTTPAERRRSSRVRVAQILPWPAIGGTEIASLRLAEAARNKDMETVAFCVGTDTPVQEAFCSRGYETVSYDPVEPSYRRPKPYLQQSWKLAQQLKKQNVDLVHCSDLLAGYHLALAARLARLPSVCHVRCEYGSISARDRSFLPMIGRFVFVSEYTRSAFAYRGAARDGVVLYDGIDSLPEADPAVSRQVRSEFGIPGHAAIVGMVARVAPVKDYATLIGAARRVTAVHPSVRFLIVGDYSSAASYRAHYAEVSRMLQEAELDQYFIFTGFRTDVHRLMSAMDVTVLVTHSEGFGLVLLEAMAMGKPVIATAVGGIPEIVIHERTGLLHPHRDGDALAKAIVGLLSHPSRAVELGGRARAWVRERFSSEAFSIEVTRLYHSMLARTGVLVPDPH